MKLERLELEGWRNYDRLSVDFHPQRNVICGENAQGKTNLLEAIAFLSTARSHRARGDKELIGFTRQEARLTARAESRERTFQIEIQLKRGQRRRIEINHIKAKNAGELSQVLRTVLFCPEDLSLIKAGAAQRRTFLDHAICQLRPRYAQALNQYQRLLEHKTRILRDWEKNPGLLSVLEEFNEAMARSGALVVHYRAHFIQKLAESAAAIQEEFSGGREHLNLTYQTVSTIPDPLKPTTQLYEQIREHQDKHARAELEARTCLSGPHKDDLFTEIDGQSARQYASQGQTRTAALSLKLAEREIFQRDTQQWPLLLLDDVLSELDAPRRAFVLDRIQGGQVFITGCEPPPEREYKGKTLHIKKGTLIPPPK